MLWRLIFPVATQNSDLFDHCRIKVTLPVSKCLPGWHLLQNGVVYDGGDQSAFRINETTAGLTNCAASRFANDARYSGSLQISARLTPPIFVDDIGERYTANRPKPSHRVADRQQGIGMDAGRQAECGLRFLLKLQIQRRQGRAEAERSRRQQHILNRWVDRRPGRAGRGAAFEARDDPHGAS